MKILCHTQLPFTNDPTSLHLSSVQGYKSVIASSSPLNLCDAVVSVSGLTVLLEKSVSLLNHPLHACPVGMCVNVCCCFHCHSVTFCQRATSVISACEFACVSFYMFLECVGACVCV